MSAEIAPEPVATGARSHATSPAQPPSALGSPRAHVLFWSTALFGLTADLSSKVWAFQQFHQGGEAVVIPNVLEFKTMFNKGALFGIGQGQTELFIGASILALGLVLWMFARSTPQRWLLHIALGAILAGALGNMYDRVFVRLYERPYANREGGFQFYGVQDGVLTARQYPVDHPQSRQIEVPVELAEEQLGRPIGAVRDFIKIPTKWFGGREVWPWVFNVADMLLVGGVGVLAIFLWREKPEDDRPHRPDSPPAAGASG